MLYYFNRDVLEFGKGEANLGNDFAIIASTPKIESFYDILIFTDSKGLSLDNDRHHETWSYKLGTDLSCDGKSVLIVTRPKEITTFFTLLNFIDLNKIKFKYLISNLGFVDFTPKKNEFILDIKRQIPHGISEKSLKVNSMGYYLLSSGKLDHLYSFDYGNNHVILGNRLAKSFELVLLLNVLEFDSTMNIKRKRPDAFFTQLKVSNKWIYLISSHSTNIKYIEHDISDLEPEQVSYDAVHFTSLGHSNLYTQLLGQCIINGIFTGNSQNSSN